MRGRWPEGGFMKKIILIAITLTTIGCTQKVWVRPGTNYEQGSRDVKECQYNMVQHNPNMDIYMGVYMIRTCMELKGYQLVDQP